MVHLTPDQALQGTVVELTLDDGTVIELNTPPFAGDGWRLRLEGVAPGGRDHFLQLRVVTDDGLRIDGLRVLYKLMLFHRMQPSVARGCADPGWPCDAAGSSRLIQWTFAAAAGRGLQLDDERGDQLVEIVVVIPSDLGDAERASTDVFRNWRANPSRVVDDG